MQVGSNPKYSLFRFIKNYIFAKPIRKHIKTKLIEQ